MNRKTGRSRAWGMLESGDFEDRNLNRGDRNVLSLIRKESSEGSDIFGWMEMGPKSVSSLAAENGFPISRRQACRNVSKLKRLGYVECSDGMLRISPSRSSRSARRTTRSGNVTASEITDGWMKVEERYGDYVYDFPTYFRLYGRCMDRIGDIPDREGRIRAYEFVTECFRRHTARKEADISRLNDDWAMRVIPMAYRGTMTAETLRRALSGYEAYRKALGGDPARTGRDISEARRMCDSFEAFSAGGDF